MISKKERIMGCLFGGALGDALGWPVEFSHIEDIERDYGSRGIRELELNSNGKAEITDDTQMTLFTAEGILRAYNAEVSGLQVDYNDYIYDSYLRWLYTQQFKYKKGYVKSGYTNGWLTRQEDLYARRAPGRTCIESLRSGVKGTMEKKLNNSKGCGGVMRVAPIGCFLEKEKAFKLACEAAAITHSHPSGFLPAGVFAYIISSIVNGQGLLEGIDGAAKELIKYEGHIETLEVMTRAVRLAVEGEPSYTNMSKLGLGWTGDEALAIAIYSCLVFRKDIKKALILSVNHSGDSDSTGAITGNILGAILGEKALPEEWVNKLELYSVIRTIGEDLYKRHEKNLIWIEKYPIAKLT